MELRFDGVEDPKVISCQCYLNNGLVAVTFKATTTEIGTKRIAIVGGNQGLVF